MLSALAPAASAQGPCAIQGDAAAEVLVFFFVVVVVALFFHIGFNRSKVQAGANKQTETTREPMLTC